MDKRTCRVETCDRAVRSDSDYGTGYCKAHRQRIRKHGDPRAGEPLRSRGESNHGTDCAVGGCANDARASKMCWSHYARLRRYGDPLAGRTPAPPWRNRQGYLVIYADGRRHLQHRFVMEQSIGRPLWPDETVHHINGVRDDNRIENLELWSHSQPKGQRVVDKLAWAREILDLYGTS